MVEDLDDDCQVSVIDIMRVAARWGQAGGAEDVNNDGTVDVNDVQQVAGAWRQTCHVLAETVKYYSLGGQRIAMRRNNALYYLFGDHLNSTSVTRRISDGQTTTQRYYPWGMIRPGPNNTLPTDHTFTGQKLDANTGLMYYSDGTSYGRYYEPALGRWSQPDSIVPDYSNPQSLNRYSYVNNRPTVLTDPDGHCGPVCAALYALWETFFGHGVSSAGGDLYDPETAEPCGDTGCVTPSKSEAEVAAGVALDVAVAETGGRLANKAVQKGSRFVRSLLGGSTETELYQAGQFVGKQLAREQVHDIGVIRGRAMARAHEFESIGWQNPFADWGAFGQGFDDIMRAPNGDWVIVEFKGGTSQLAGNQMTEKWVRRNILRLRQAGDPMGDVLRDALKQGGLSGVVYSTPIEEGVIQPTRTIWFWYGGP